jgi:hypothetical protein
MEGASATRERAVRGREREEREEREERKRDEREGGSWRGA